MSRNYDTKLSATRNYEEKLSHEIMRRNYEEKLSASRYHHAKNVGIIGILAYPKTIDLHVYMTIMSFRSLTPLFK